MTVLGLGSYAVAWAIGIPGYQQPQNPLDAFGLLHLAGDLGLHLAQFADNLPLHTLSEKQRTQLREEAERQQIAIEVGTRGIEYQHLQGYIELAQFFGSSILRVVADTATYHPSPDELTQHVRALLPALENAKVQLAIENHDRFKAQTLGEIIEIIDHPNVGICLDTVNSFGAAEGPEHVVETLGSSVVNLHIKDFTIRRLPHNLGFEVTGTPAGQGMLNVPWLLASLYDQGCNFNAILELWPAPETSVTETVAKEKDWVWQSISYLRTLIKD